MTYAEYVKEANDNGKIVGVCRTAYQMGYVSRRKFDRDSAEVITAGGRCKGSKYYLSPCYKSSRFCIRNYLVEYIYM